MYQFNFMLLNRILFLLLQKSIETFGNGIDSENVEKLKEILISGKLAISRHIRNFYT